MSHILCARVFIKTHTGIDISQMNENEVRNVAKNLEIEVDNTMGHGKLIDQIFGSKCEHHYINPTFIIDLPRYLLKIQNLLDLSRRDKFLSFLHQLDYEINIFVINLRISRLLSLIYIELEVKKFYILV